MAENNPALTQPAATKHTELWYSEQEDTGLKQVFGVQGIPVIKSAPEDITYRTLENGTEFAVPGVRPYETIEIETLHMKEQYEALKTLEESGATPWWYVQLPPKTAGSASGSKPLVIKWQGAVSISIAEVSLDDMVKDVLTIGKSTVPVDLEGLPSGNTPSV